MITALQADWLSGFVPIMRFDEDIQPVPAGS